MCVFMHVHVRNSPDRSVDGRHSLPCISYEVSTGLGCLLTLHIAGLVGLELHPQVCSLQIRHSCVNMLQLLQTCAKHGPNVYRCVSILPCT